jgi:hypothetical protein
MRGRRKVVEVVVAMAVAVVSIPRLILLASSSRTHLYSFSSLQDT